MATIPTPSIDVPFDTDLLNAVGLDWPTRIGIQTLRNQGKIMAAIDNLNAAVTAVQTTTANLLAQFASINQQLATAIAANDPTKIQAAADALNKIVSDEQAALAAATQPAASAPAPAAPAA